MNVAEHLRDRRVVRRAGLAAAAVAALIAAFAYQQSRPGAPTYVGPGAHPFAQHLGVYGHPIKLPQSALDTARKFVQTAVLRKDPAASWDLVTPALRAGTTRTEWSSGNIPVTPFPASAFRQAAFQVTRSRSKNIMLEVAISSSKSSIQAAYDYLEMVPVNGRWLVTYFGPVGYQPPVPSNNPGA